MVLILLIIVGTAAPLAARSGQGVVIGVATSLTSLEGRESLMAARLAVEEVNRGGGVVVGGRRVELHLATIDLMDAAPDRRVEDAVKRLEDFLTARPIQALVVGPFRSEVLLPAMDVISRHRIPMLGTIAMTPAMASKVMKDPAYRYIFRTGLDTRYLADTLIEAMRFLDRRYGFHRVFIMSQDVAWARSTASLMIKLYFERAGWQILGTRHYPSQTADFAAGLREAAALKAQVILPIFDTPRSGELVIQWKAMAVPALLCGFISPMMGPGAWERFNGQIDGALNVVFELGNIPSRRFPPASTFYQAFKARYGQEIESGHGPAPAYASIHLLARAMTQVGDLDGDRLVAALERSDQVGVMGRLRFNKGHQVIFGTNPQEAAVACLVQWRDPGRRIIVYPPALAEGEILLPTAAKP
jgi:branched-chain amino acid transport system substrate-binding protein